MSPNLVIHHQNILKKIKNLRHLKHLIFFLFKYLLRSPVNVSLWICYMPMQFNTSFSMVQICSVKNKTWLEKYSKPWQTTVVEYCCKILALSWHMKMRSTQHPSDPLLYFQKLKSCHSVTLLCAESHMCTPLLMK